jgi:hypothetical protein
MEEVLPFDQSIVPLDITESNLFIDVRGGKDTKEALQSITKKYALIIHQRGDGHIMVMTPFYLLSAASDPVLNFWAWNFSLLDGTMWDVDYGDVTSNVNAVIVIGNSASVGIAVDVIASQLTGGRIVYQLMENRSVVGKEACEQIARNKLLELERNNIISFKTLFNPEFMVGQPIQLQDNDRFTGEEIFILKRYAFTIDKGDVSCDITAYAHSLTTLPEDIVLSNTGIADVDSLGIREKVVDLTGWQDALS